jgi:hypothetical protein
VQDREISANPLHLAPANRDESPDESCDEPPTHVVRAPVRARVTACLRILEGRGPRELVLSPSAVRWIVGRGKTADLVLDDEDVSREHFEVLRQPDGALMVFDLGSKNGLVVNGRETNEHRLASGDELRAGTTVLRFET